MTPEQLERRIRAQVNNNNYRARTLYVQTGLTLTEWRRILLASEGKCHFCSAVIGIERLEMEHLVPLAGGGPHIASNVVPSCVRCNRRKQVNAPLRVHSVPVPSVGWCKAGEHCWSLSFVYILEPGYKVEVHISKIGKRLQSDGYTYVYKPSEDRWKVSKSISDRELDLLWPAVLPWT